MRERLAVPLRSLQPLSLPLLALLTTLTAFGAGLTLMTHMHHRALRFIEPGAMESFDSGYELLSDVTVIPVGVFGLVCTLALLVLRPPGVPRWMLATTAALQLSVFVTRIWMWGAWAEEVREAGSVRLADGTLHPSYTQYMDTNWIRIALIASYAALALTMTVLAARRARTSGAARGAVPAVV
ncbi:hypothetical protein H9Y04_19905 [Streptomyces sp. TRM66268-LWL]|uniref:DUF1772 domain-containing protein n=1 Tax=Streptomyces polyasparticus TaxID=2767826 RepID=A0ABR7SK15_9ACTN|nr:hypothetical protein [Streptomyces polyasparticus]MBC9714821.1 hypothetical protein [Streptomyces polyasparticus]